jgi:hypothetical protein
LEPLLTGLLKTGAPWGVLCAVLLVAVAALWRRSVQLSDKLYDLATSQVKQSAEVHGTLTNTLKELEELRRCFK